MLVDEEEVSSSDLLERQTNVSIVVVSKQSHGEVQRGTVFLGLLRNALP